MMKATIRGLDEELYTQARIVAVEEKCSVAEIINAALEDWLSAEDAEAEPVSIHEAVDEVQT